MSKPYPTIRQIENDSHGRAMFELTQNFGVSIPVGTFGSLCIDVPAGTVTDFASVPTWLWSIVNPMNRHLTVAALVHDGLYSKVANCPRAQADTIFRFIADWYGASWWEQWKTFYAVRLFGWLAYQKS